MDCGESGHSLWAVEFSQIERESTELRPFTLNVSKNKSENSYCSGFCDRGLYLFTSCHSIYFICKLFPHVFSYEMNRKIFLKLCRWTSFHPTPWGFYIVIIIITVFVDLDVLMYVSRLVFHSLSPFLRYFLFSPKFSCHF